MKDGVCSRLLSPVLLPMPNSVLRYQDFNLGFLKVIEATSFLPFSLCYLFHCFYILCIFSWWSDLFWDIYLAVAFFFILSCSFLGGKKTLNIMSRSSCGHLWKHLTEMKTELLASSAFQGKPSLIKPMHLCLHNTCVLNWLCPAHDQHSLTCFLIKLNF